MWSEAVAEAEAELPMACEGCLGPSPYVAMRREVGGAACGVCGRPVTVFTWSRAPGTPPLRTRVCRACAGAKAVCQSCLNDLRYGLPVAVRDALVAAAFERVGAKRPREAADAIAASGGGAGAWAVAARDVMGQDGANAERPRAGAGAEEAALAAAHEDLARHAALRASRERGDRMSRPRPCSFFAKGKCKRGTACPFRHEVPSSGLSRSREGQAATARAPTVSERYFGILPPGGAGARGR